MDKKMLVVDSDQETSKVFHKLFKKIGFQVDTSQPGQKAYELMKKKPYDCILISYEPSIEGDNDLFIYTKKSLPNAMTIAITDNSSIENTTNPIEQGADAVFTKPVKINLLIKAVEENIQAKQSD